MIDPSFSKNNFNEPKYYNESETLARNVLFVLFGVPGFYPSIPTLGMDIKSYLYGFFDEISEESIKAKLGQQCSEFIKHIQTGEIEVKKGYYQGQPLIAFALPVMIDKASQRLVLGVSLNAKGQVIYNFTFDDSSSF